MNGDSIGFVDYEFVVTGGSDYCGFPMRKDVEGYARKRILSIQGVGVRKKGKGTRIKKTVCGNTIHPKIAQVNLKVQKEGKEQLVQAEKTESPGKTA